MRKVTCLIEKTVFDVVAGDHVGAGREDIEMMTSWAFRRSAENNRLENISVLGAYIDGSRVEGLACVDPGVLKG
jgi:hypothetical protein